MCKQIIPFAIIAISMLIHPLSLSSQNSFSLSLDANGAAGDQAVASVNTSANQNVSIQVFGSQIQNANGFGIRFEYDASQVVYEGFDAGSVLPGTPQVLPDHFTNPTSVEIGLASFGGQATVSSGLVGTIRFRTTAAFSGTAIRLVQAQVSRGGQFESATLTARVELRVSTALSSDFNGDGRVGISDFLLFVNQFGSGRGDGTYQAKYDLDSDGVIGISDFLIFVDDFGTGGTSTGGGGNSGGGGSGGSGSDLIVESPSVSDETVTPGQSFTLWATVHNRGNSQSAVTTLRYYRSTDATITTNDTPAGQDAVESLAASGNSFESISLQAPNTSGTYYYGACVESVGGEVNTANNCSPGTRVIVAGETFDQTVAQVQSLEAELDQNRMRVNQEISELRENHPLNAPKSQFETDAEYAARQSQLASILAQSHQELMVRYRLQETQTQIAQLYRKTFPKENITANLGEYNANEGYFPITFETTLNGASQRYDERLMLNRDDARTLHDNWGKVVAKGYLVIGKGYRRALAWIGLEYTPIWPQGFWWSIAEVSYDLDNNNEAVEFSPDGKYILTGDNDGRAVLWNVKNGESIWHTQVGNAISSVAFSLDGQYFAIGYHGQAGVWTTSNGTRIFSKSHGYTHNWHGYVSSPVYAVALSPDGQYLATGDDKENEGNRWEVSSGEHIGMRHGYIHNWHGYVSSPVYAVAFSPDGQYLATGDKSGRATLWSTSSGERIRRMQHVDAGSIWTLAYSLKGNYLATGSSEGKVTLWIPSTGQNIQTIEHGSSISAVAFSSGANYLAVGEGKAITIYQVPPTITIETQATKTHTVEVLQEIDDLAWSPDGRFISDGKKVYRVHLQRPNSATRSLSDGQAIPVEAALR